MSNRSQHIANTIFKKSWNITPYDLREKGEPLKGYSKYLDKANPRGLLQIANINNVAKLTTKNPSEGNLSILWQDYWPG